MDGKVDAQIIKSSKIWDKQKHDNDIAIGNGAYILWKDWDWKNETIEYIDALLGDVEIMFDKLELACYRGCCGIEAFVFTPGEIKKAGNESESNLQEKIDQIISTLNSTESVVIGMKNLNINIAKSVFIRLLHHIKNCL